MSQTALAARSCAIALDSSRVLPVGVACRPRRVLQQGRLARPPAISTTSRLFSETSQTAPAARSEKYFCAIALDSSRVRPVGVAHWLRLIGKFNFAHVSGSSSDVVASVGLELEILFFCCRGLAL